MSACASYDIDAVEGMKNNWSSFQKELQKEYIVVARDEDKEHDFEDAAFFTNKASMTAMGEAVLPQEIKDRNLPADSVKDLEFARAGLMDALANTDRNTNAAALARAQAQFDCWLQEQEENRQPADIEACKLAFNKAMDMIKYPEMKVAEKPKPKPKPAPKKPDNKIFIVFFDFDSAELTAKAKGRINDAIKEAKATNPKLIQLGGHADTSGDQVYNNALSQKRAMAVAKMINDAGFGGKQVKTAMFGEDFPVRNLGDNVKNGANRRVEILLKY